MVSDCSEWLTFSIHIPLTGKNDPYQTNITFAQNFPHADHKTT